jgi:hypothetical protein
MKDRPKFKETNKAYEPINPNTNMMVEEYQRADYEKINNPSGTNRIVYDCMDQSPFYNDP